MDKLQKRLNQIWPGWTLNEELGHGSFGKVYRIVREDSLGHQFDAALNMPQKETKKTNVNSKNRRK